MNIRKIQSVLLHEAKKKKIKLRHYRVYHSYGENVVQAKTAKQAKQMVEDDGNIVYGVKWEKD